MPKPSEDPFASLATTLNSVGMFSFTVIGMATTSIASWVSSNLLVAPLEHAFGDPRNVFKFWPPSETGFTVAIAIIPGLVGVLAQLFAVCVYLDDHDFTFLDMAGHLLAAYLFTLALSAQLALLLGLFYGVRSVVRNVRKRKQLRRGKNVTSHIELAGVETRGYEETQPSLRKGPWMV